MAHKYFTLPFLIFLLIALALVFPANAQNDDALVAPQQQETMAPPNRYSDIPDVYLIEAMNYAQECSDSQVMQLYYDCRCMGAEYLERRIALGPEAPRSQVAQRIGPACADGTGIAGSLYQDCKKNYVQVPANVGVEDYCSCYGNTYAKMFERMNRPLLSREHVALMTQARVACANPSTARRIFGYVPN